jgi:dolichol kinase
MPDGLGDWLTPEDLRGALILSGAFLGLIAIAELWRRFGHPNPEHTRKLVHLGGGMACLFFPFLVHSPWVVLAMALPLTILFVAGSKLGFLKSLHGVARKSRGAEYYPMAVFLVFVMTLGRPWLYLAAVLVLAVADAFAALIGSRYGVIRYEVEDEHKSLEGSLVFLVIAFLAVHLPTLLLTDLPRPVCVLAALLVAALVTGFEAISLEGADNLFVPVAVVVVLGKITTKPLSEVIFQNLSLLVICLVVAVLVWRLRSLNVGGTITYILFAYGTWSLGNWLWALPAFIGFFCYLAAWYRFAPPGHAVGIKVRTVTRALLPPFAMLALANGFGRFPMFYAPYLAASAAVFAFSLDTGVFRLEKIPGAVRSLGALALGVLACAAIVLPPWLALRALPWPALLALTGLVMLTSLANAAIELRYPEERSREWTGWRFLLSFAVAGAVLGLQALGWIPMWDPKWPLTP